MNKELLQQQPNCIPLCSVTLMSSN